MAIKKVTKTVSAKKPVKTAATVKQAASKKTVSAKPKIAAKTTDLPTAAVIRIAKANGAERVGGDGAAAILLMTEQYIGKLTKEANIHASQAGRKTLKEEDIEIASQII